MLTATLTIFGALLWTERFYGILPLFQELMGHGALTQYLATPPNGLFSFPRQLYWQEIFMDLAGDAAAALAWGVVWPNRRRVSTLSQHHPSP